MPAGFTLIINLDGRHALCAGVSKHSMEVSLFLIFIATIFLLVKAIEKVHFLDLREGSEKIKAEVIDYRKEKGPMRNDYTRLNYPYVKILTDGPDRGKVRRLRFATNWSKRFKKGQTIYVF
jgi:hypothetical protein